ncbi:NADP-dependent 3-hydroxy acid dehydrogenase YdfG [Amycolatopsis echigonensis]|uniref:NADP-dependent 3-hydroxy acid dehydrogenase YdfG n=1 Tax=Amycolatopsis echigonensis TaxID=2576905 RepID=A0A2N3WTU5_9PSEU|nr:SDR family oxidoreductase [Amycolatopsis niigatensis]PKV97265.1 NADP-dependent 3-hydroxy acid dehydrogenase YdfG [Amycolatopsis niigatensis]
MNHPVRRRKPELALVTGAAGGVGSATARRLVEDGAKVALTDLNAERLKELAHELGAVALPADGTDRAAIHDVVEQAVAQLGGLDTVIAAQGAAVSGTARPAHVEAYQRALDVNLHGSYYLAGEVLPHLVERQGSLVLFASTAGLIAGPPGTVGYTAAKAGIIGITRWLARDYGPKGVRVNAVCPGWVRTPLGEGAMAYLAKREGITLDEAYALTTKHVPLRRAAEPEEIASVCAFLASGDASMVTGHVLVADGGGAAVDSSTLVFDEP